MFSWSLQCKTRWWALYSNSAQPSGEGAWLCMTTSQDEEWQDEDQLSYTSFWIWAQRRWCSLAVQSPAEEMCQSKAEPGPYIITKLNDLVYCIQLEPRQTEADTGFMISGVTRACVLCTSTKFLTIPLNLLTTPLITAITWPFAALWQQNGRFWPTFEFLRWICNRNSWLMVTHKFCQWSKSEEWNQNHIFAIFATDMATIIK